MLIETPDEAWQADLTLLEAMAIASVQPDMPFQQGLANAFTSFSARQSCCGSKAAFCVLHHWFEMTQAEA